MSVTKQVVQVIVQNIKSGQWKVGEKIPSENKLTQELGVSRSSLRAALHQFIGLGVMKSMHGKGTFLISDDISGFDTVRDQDKIYDYDMLTHLLQFRLLIEPRTCELAAQKAAKEDVDKLRHYFQKMHEAIKTPESFVIYDMQFHEELARIAGNPVVTEALHSIFHNRLESLNSISELFGYKDGIYYHMLILRAIEEGDASRAKQCMRSHIQKAIDDLEFERRAEKEEIEFLKKNL